ncbi:MMPL family transporter [Actinotalea sp. K2]|uniref:MMPL family transporter n=1 Tax=Actinotalea sp. K2 TaxID=2939438 RepID=UPI0020181FAE|nr:MMPL family transporter [Actinotalea sp. K2]MCL3859766.1 MMPL family transporter [Actinotalea sp. K2]
MAELLYRLGQFSARRARAVVAAWFAVLALAAVAFAVAGGSLATGLTIPGTPTAEVTERLTTEFPEASGGTGTVVFTTDDGAPFTQEQQAALSGLIAEAADLQDVTTVVDPFVTEAERSAQVQQVEQGRTQLEQGREQLAQGQAELDQGRAQAEAAGMLEMVAPELDAQQAAIDEGLLQLEEQALQLEVGAQLLEMSTEIRTVSQDGSAAIATVAFTQTQFEVADETREAVVDTLGAGTVPGVTADVSAEILTGVPEILGVGEAVGVVVAGIVLVVMLGTFVAAGLPILTALIGVGIGALGALSLSGVVEMVSVTPVLGVMLGLAVGIDYTLFIVNRHRRQLLQGYDVEESIGLANGTSGNAVVFAGATVIIALLALNVTGIPFLGLMGTIGAMCVAIAVVIAVTLTPALLALLGRRVLRRRDRAPVAELAPPSVGDVRPMSSLVAVGRVVACVVGLLILAVPALSLRLGLPDGSSEGADSTQYQAYTAVAEKFGPGQNGPLLVVADLPGGLTEPEVLAHQVRIGAALFEQPDVVAVAPIGTSQDGTVAAFQVVPVDGPTSVSTEELVHDLRALSPLDGQIPVAVAGLASGAIDISDKLADALPFYLAVVVGLSMIILIIVFRSIFVPVIATLGFVLSYFAALGGVVAIYQWGWLGAVFGVDNPGPVLSFLPTILVGILFGLAMDYMLFLGSGMREAYAHGAPARLAVVQGVRAGRAVVTAAAIIMISVFGGFIFAHSAMIRPIGFALAFGVLVDAFVVRMVLVPALMHLAAEKAWWLPRWLDRLLPDVDVEGAALERRHPHHEPSTGEVEAGALR